VQVDPIQAELKPPGTKRLKLKCDILLSTYAFKFSLRRYNWVAFERAAGLVRRREVTVRGGWALVPHHLMAGAYTRQLFSST
jgi:hypothetical protein